MTTIAERLYSRFFHEDDGGEEFPFRIVLDWVSQEYHAKFLEWLDAESSKPLPITADLVKAAVRANTLKEVRDHLVKLEKGALAAQARARE
jgi:hypothetical protein